ncbi:MAG: hypothetical protein AAF299_16225 [Pseudomonadota bacterium]
MSDVGTSDSFAQWVARISDPKGSKLALGNRKVSQCVITVATGYPANLLKPLINSLREHSDAHLIVAAHADSGFEEVFADQRVTVYPVSKTTGYRPYPALARLEYYLDILKGMPVGIEQLLLVDSRDVMFQADPFATLPQNDLTVFAENNDTSSWTLANTNGRWAWAMLPGALRQSLKGKPIVNGGVIAGTPAGIERMCRAKLNIALTTHEWTKHTTGLDNISTNLIAHSLMAGPCVVVPNHELVANVYRDTDMVIDPDGKIRIRDGQPCPVVHMYDRQADLLAHVNERYGVLPDATMVVSEDRSVGKSQPFSGLMHWLKLARICVRGHA